MKKYLFSLYVIMALFLVCTCSFTQPQKTIVLNLAAQNSGFLVAQEKPELAQDILEVTNRVLEMADGEIIQITFHEWAASIIKTLKLDPFLEMNFTEMIKLVNIEIELTESQQEIVKLTYAVIQNFIIGIEAGNQ